jgi:HSP20 family protein
MHYSPIFSAGLRTKSPITHLLNGILADGFHQFAGNDFAQNQPSVNFIETTDGFRLELAAPGYQKEQFQLRLENNHLQITAEVTESSKNEGIKWLRREFAFNQFTRQFPLPKTVNFEAISAVYELGILTIHLPLRADSKPIQKTVSVN